MRRGLCGLVGALFLALIVQPLASRHAQAVPSFAAQTGQPCTACHVGAFGPQLTPAGRAFKIGGYTQTGGEGLAAQIPLAAIVQTSFTNTNSSQPGPAAPDFGRNNNFALDQVSLFLAGRATDYLGGFIQGTYSGIDHGFHLDNTDLRLTTPFDVGSTELRIGLDANNGPTVQDPFNSTFAWGYPYISSSLAPTPTAQPLLNGGLIGNSIGVTAYGWYDRRLYVEAGGYSSYGPSALKLAGVTFGPGSTGNIAPYARVAYEWNWNRQDAYVGAIVLASNINPATSGRTVNGSLGWDHYTDFAADAGYEFLGNGTNIASGYVTLVHENQSLTGTFANGGASQPNNWLNQVRANVSYFYRNTYGVTLGWQDTWGNPNPALFAPAPVTGSANGKPNSNAFIIEADWIPFGKEGSWGAPFANLKLGAQYTAYTRFNGGTKNYDGFGRNASGNNTLFLFAWLAL